MLEEEEEPMGNPLEPVEPAEPAEPGPAAPAALRPRAAAAAALGILACCHKNAVALSSGLTGDRLLSAFRRLLVDARCDEAVQVRTLG